VGFAKWLSGLHANDGREFTAVCDQPLKSLPQELGPFPRRYPRPSRLRFRRSVESRKGIFDTTVCNFTNTLTCGRAFDRKLAALGTGPPVTFNEKP